MFVDDSVLVKEFGSVCKRRKFVVNVGKSKVVRIGKNREENVLDIQLHDCRMKEVDCYRLDVDKSSDGRMFCENRRSKEGIGSATDSLEK